MSSTFNPCNGWIRAYGDEDLRKPFGHYSALSRLLLTTHSSGMFPEADCSKIRCGAVCIEILVLPFDGHFVV